MEEDYSRSYILQIKHFVHKQMKLFCEKHNLPVAFTSLTNFQHNEKDFLGENFVFLSVAPKILLAASKSFLSYYINLKDADMKQELITREEIKYYKMEIINNKRIKLFLSKLLQEDFLF